MEKTLVIIKPDGVKRHLVGKIIQRFEEKGLVITALKMETLTLSLLEEHYNHLVTRPFFSELVDYMTSGPVVILILTGENAIEIVRKMVGATNPLQAEIGSIRGQYGLSHTENVIHASDSTAAAQAEIQRFFK